MELSLARDTASWGDLLCKEDADELDGLPVGSPATSAVSEFPNDSDESIAVFVEGEAEYSPAVDYPARLRSRSIDPAARELAVAWILQVHAYYNFQPLTAYLAVNYMDRFLSAHRLPQSNGWPLQLLSVACLSLASKMEETIVPSLIDLQVEGAKYIFEPRTICKMELLVLTALKWRLRSVTPFNYIDFFASKVDPSGLYATDLVSSAAQIILSAINDIDFLDHCPSSIAAAIIMCAVDEAPDLAFIDPRQAVKWCSGLTKIRGRCWSGIERASGAERASESGEFC
ncbi:cyclin-D2-1-like isoform X2 [Phalaenopsis equestris]|uniref:cyclin-D2-1-like isoform X2 n=1 Tax=Phalaenopsis equestris TaxID=78828 RepID=UPI0009E3C054|nr:cyclin-D2-1-like isoform X2 [Phalaenopsis equestris]